MPTANTLPDSKPTVLIVGAGIAGLTLGILLEKAGVPYEIYDRMAEVKPLANVAPLFQQIGIYDDLVRLGKLCDSIDQYSEDRKFDYSMDIKATTQMGGFPGYIVSRSAFHDLLFRQIPSNKIFLGKRVVSIKQSLENGVQLQFSDKTIAEGDILVGADGAYSAVRQSLYDSLKSEGQLPASDDGALPFTCVCLAGQTKPMDPEKYPELADPKCHFTSVIGDNKPYSVEDFHGQSESSKSHDSFRNSEWGPEAAIAMCKEVQDFPVPGGKNNDMTIGDLIDSTPLISKVMLEEKVFDTWYSERTVLVGDACHKIHPASGAGAMNAIQDAVALANWISVLDSTATNEITKAYKEYKAERYPVAKASFARGRMLSRVTENGLRATIARYLTKNMPTCLGNILTKRAIESRPQVSFLPLVEDKGTVPPKYQPSLQRTLEIRKARETTEARQATAPIVIEYKGC
ncbi:hypothetical protein BCR41DRAFT_402155 [Lobosporangium transversale]|uniref:FAD-binding domain-containing protein n=1 Tax=Lobosporangium transversale TaxID=64571 RepID=A0A1Y2G5W0_9FUNG|nr:hypothetical protein BCR41DRAFT_402155 [Lobosporangium transversale]ORY96055.1 hypothetical protein BCR41DRAFT_402155 [Lobosporangium transversale]|eukprot:XP_021875482.1 hypothetical protein BCR41DRAFT_402155 [Lobosporangium transversale]